MRWILFSLLFFLLQLPLSAAAVVVRVGIDSNPPLTDIDATTGHAQGLFPELLQEIAKEHNWELQFVPCQWKDCLSKLESAQLDILPAIAYTEERAKKYLFADETVFTSWGQVYQRAEDDNLDSILQLDGKKLAVIAKDVYYVSDQGMLQVANKFDVKIDYLEVTSNREAFEKLATGEVDAALVGRIFGIKNRQKFALRPAPILIKPIQVRPAFAGPAAKQLKQQFDQTLSGWKTSNTSIYYQLLEKWLGEKLTPPVPKWFTGLMYSLSTVLCLLLLTTIWTRRQVKRRTLELADKNRLLEDELIERQTVEAELRERQQQYQVLFEGNQAAMLLIDPQTAELVDANQAACDFYQYPREALRKMHISDLNELSVAEIQRKLQQINARELKIIELPHRLANGEIRPVEIMTSPIIVEGRSLICSIIRDISKRKKAEKEVAARNDFLQSVIDGVSDPLMVIDFDYQVLQMNEAASEKLPLALADQEKLTCHQVSHSSAVPCSGEGHPCPIREVQETGQPVTVIHNHVDSYQKLRIVEVNASPLYNAEGELYAVIEVARDITERQQAEELLSENEKRLHHLAHHDILTNLPNRMLFDDRLKQALSKAKRTRKQVALFFIDLDHFKDVNDNLGHDFGDLMLIDVAKRLIKSIRESDTVARLGGDEFLILLDEVESIQMIEMMAERICDALIHELDRENYSQRLSASIGISIFPEDGSNGQELLKAADQAMYQAKGKGKATYQFASTPQAHFDF